MAKWMTIEEAAKYAGLGKTVLYSLVKDGSIPASKVGQKWLLNSDTVDGWIKANKPIKDFFTTTPYNILENLQLREPQVQAYTSVYEYFAEGHQTAIIQIPVGCGKSGLAALLPFGIAKGRVMVVTPNLTIMKGMVETLDVTNLQKCFWKIRGVLEDTDMIGGPYVCSLDTGNISTADKSHIIVTNVQQLTTNPEKWLAKFPQDFFDLIIVDEAHHSAADSWQLVLERFPDAKIVNMTATPFRSDKAEIAGKLVYRYPFKRATVKGFVKKVQAWYVAPSEMTFTAKGETKTYILDEVLKLKEHDWFSKGIALSDICNIHIVDNSLEKLEELRQTGTHHQLIAVACSVDHAKEIRSLYNARGYKADVIYSQLAKDKIADVMRQLKSGELDCIIQVQMLGEGFDHPKLSVAAIFRPFRTLAPYIQFVGRILRVIVQNNPTHPDNYGYVVTHVGMNLDQRLREFKLFEQDDQRFWDEVIGGNPPDVPRQVASGEGRQRNRELNFANDEIVESLIGEDFISLDEEELIRELAIKLQELGLDPEAARDVYFKQKQPSEYTAEAARAFQVLPQSEWTQLRTRLNERVRRSANLLLNRLELDRSKRDLVQKGVSASNNFIACNILVNREITKRNSAPRKDWTAEQFKSMMDSLDDILNDLTRYWKAKLNVT